MKAVRHWGLSVAAVATLAVAPAKAELVFEGVHWQTGRVEQGRVIAWQDVKVLVENPPKISSRIRARLVLRNRGAIAEEGLLIRYSVTARVIPVGGGPAEGTWAVPFALEEKRVPKIAANRSVDVSLEPAVALEAQLKRLTRAGWWPDRIKINAMLEPHRGAANLQVAEDTLDIKRVETVR